MSDLDHFLPFRQHAPSLANARRHIYAELDGLSSDDGVGFFNILAFRGVFFGSPFARSNQFRWFDSLEDWEGFRNNHHEADQYRGEEYYVVKHCYGQSQAGRQLSLLSSYWTLRNKWNDTFDKSDKSKKPTVTNVFRFLTSNSTNSNKTLFPNIGKLTALLICGDLVEAGILPMPSTKDWAESINKMGKGSKAGMETCGFIGESCKTNFVQLLYCWTSPSKWTQRWREGGHELQNYYAGTHVVQDQLDKEMYYWRGVLFRNI